MYTLLDLKHALEAHGHFQNVDVIDESSLHADHYDPARRGITHIHIKARCIQHPKPSRLEAHRIVYAILDPFIQQGLHAIRISLQEENPS